MCGWSLTALSKRLKGRSESGREEFLGAQKLYAAARWILPGYLGCTYVSVCPLMLGASDLQLPPAPALGAEMCKPVLISLLETSSPLCFMEVKKRSFLRDSTQTLLCMHLRTHTHRRQHTCTNSHTYTYTCIRPLRGGAACHGHGLGQLGC